MCEKARMCTEFSHGNPIWLAHMQAILAYCLRPVQHAVLLQTVDAAVSSLLVSVLPSLFANLALPCLLLPIVCFSRQQLAMLLPCSASLTIKLVASVPAPLHVHAACEAVLGSDSGRVDRAAVQYDWCPAAPLSGGSYSAPCSDSL